jgi:predicted enzyme related to lactoylglutathione lyase
MLVNAPVHAILPAVDLGRARKFYEEKLGLKAVRVDPDPAPGVLFQAGDGTKLYIYKRAATKAEHTVAGFIVADVEAEVKELQAKGVVFQELDVPSMGLKTVNGVATMGTIKGAWFMDTEGNILSVMNIQ